MNFALSELFDAPDRTTRWTVLFIRLSDSRLPSSFNWRCVKAQIRSLLPPDLVAHYARSAFCDKYVPTIRNSEGEHIVQCACVKG